MLNTTSSKGFRVRIGWLSKPAPFSPQEQVWENEGGAAAKWMDSPPPRFRLRVVLGRRG
jgi:hypothetical protein